MKIRALLIAWSGGPAPVRNGVCTNSSGYLTWRGGTTDVFHNPCDPADINEGVTVFWKACFHDLSKGDPRVCVDNPRTLPA